MSVQIQLNNLGELEKIGSGKFGKVYKIITEDGKKVVLKISKFAPADPEETEANLSKLKHKNILKVYGCQMRTDLGGFYIVMEYAKNGSLHTFLHELSSNHYTIPTALSWIQQCAKGLEHLHSIKIPHENLKSENLLLFNKCQTLKISDISYLYDGMIVYADHKLISAEVNDIFSFGNVIREIFSRKKISDFEHTGNTGNMDYFPDYEHLDELKTLVSMCLEIKMGGKPNMKVLSTFISALYQSSLKVMDIINWEQIKLIDPPIGRGSFGDVFKAVWKTERFNRNIAVKKFNEINLSIDFERELENLSFVNHENIVKLFGATKNEEKPHKIAMEYADLGSLYDFLHDPMIQVTIFGKLHWLLQCAKAVAYLHDQNPKILHRDLKSRNLLLFNEYQTLKICDFGTARPAHTQMSNEVGTAGYMAPEVINSDSYTEKCDVYSFGILMWEIMSQKKPFHQLDISLTIMRKTLKRERPPIDDIKTDYKHLKRWIQNCWDTNPKKRPTMKEMVARLGTDPDYPNFLTMRPLREVSIEDYLPNVNNINNEMDGPLSEVSTEDYQPNVNIIIKEMDID